MIKDSALSDFRFCILPFGNQTESNMAGKPPNSVRRAVARLLGDFPMGFRDWGPWSSHGPEAARGDSYINPNEDGEETDEMILGKSFIRLHRLGRVPEYHAETMGNV